VVGGAMTAIDPTFGLVGSFKGNGQYLTIAAVIRAERQSTLAH
jgi:hypothetical protein